MNPIWSPSVVQSKIVGGKVGELRVDYRLRQKEGVWYVIDISVEGVSLVSSYRSQFPTSCR